MKNPYVLILEDHPLVADSLAACVHACNAALRVVIRGSLNDAIQTLTELPQPLLILTDLTLPDAAGMESVRQLRQVAPQCKLLVCTALDTPELRAEAKDRGVMGYLIKNASTETLRAEISNALGDTSALSFSKSKGLGSHGPILTNRHIQILEELTSGRNNKEIATRLHISPDTVGSHMKEILARLSAKTRTEAVAQYLRLKD